MFHKQPTKKRDSANDAEQVNDYIVKIRNLSFSYGENKVLDDINLLLKRGEVTTILGPNGGGKTSLIRIIVGISKEYTGSIQYHNDLVIGYLPQHFNVNPLIPMTAEYFLHVAFNKKNKKLSIEDILNSINIKKILNQQVSQLSEGELQLLLLARCLMVQPDLIVLDEPVSCMDVSAKNSFYKLVGELVSTYRLSIIMTSHDLHLVMSSSNKVICLNRRIYCEDTPDKVAKDKNFSKIFGNYL